MSIAAVVAMLAALLGVLNLALMLGVIRRLREHTELLSRAPEGTASIGRGEAVDAFDAVTVDGETVSRESLLDGSVVAFFSATCAPCQERLPKFVAYAKTLPEGRRQALAVVIGEGEDLDGFVTALGPVARVVVEKASDPVNSAFGVQRYPVVLAVARDDRGRLTVRSDRVNLNRPAPVAA
ncbi:hypothetical protein GCM10010149_45100 [Nonomuraea roseoviolacea subsp. roseoviolacea]|uniref:TlpA family protein disulfide reductase n=1 Tax=Nonomuraea roseoviolacea TaxID=103837 RepID=UPI0031DE30F5